MTGDEEGRESGLRGSRLWAREAGRTLSTAAGTNTAQSRQPQEPLRASQVPPPCFFLRDLHHGMGAEGLFPPRSHLLHFPSPLPSWHRKAVLVGWAGTFLPCILLAQPGRGPEGTRIAWRCSARGWQMCWHSEHGAVGWQGAEGLIGQQVPGLASHVVGHSWKHTHGCADTPSTAGLLPQRGSQLSCSPVPSFPVFPSQCRVESLLSADNEANQRALCPHTACFPPTPTPSTMTYSATGACGRDSSAQSLEKRPPHLYKLHHHRHTCIPGDSWARAEESRRSWDMHCKHTFVFTFHSTPSISERSCLGSLAGAACWRAGGDPRAPWWCWLHLSQLCTLFNALLVLVSILLTSVIFVKRHGRFHY